MFEASSSIFGKQLDSGTILLIHWLSQRCIVTVLVLLENFENPAIAILITRNIAEELKKSLKILFSLLLFRFFPCLHNLWEIVIFSFQNDFIAVQS